MPPKHERRGDFYCAMCNKKFSTKTGLSQHQGRIHFNMTESIPSDLHCHVCEKTFASAFQYGNHTLRCKPARDSPNPYDSVANPYEREDEIMAQLPADAFDGAGPAAPGSNKRKNNLPHEPPKEYYQRFVNPRRDERSPSPPRFVTGSAVMPRGHPPFNPGYQRGAGNFGRKATKVEQPARNIAAVPPSGFRKDIAPTIEGLAPSQQEKDVGSTAYKFNSFMAELESIAAEVDFNPTSNVKGPVSTVNGSSPSKKRNGKASGKVNVNKNVNVHGKGSGNSNKNANGNGDGNANANAKGKGKTGTNIPFKPLPVARTKVKPQAVDSFQAVTAITHAPRDRGPAVKARAGNLNQPSAGPPAPLNGQPGTAAPFTFTGFAPPIAFTPPQVPSATKFPTTFAMPVMGPSGQPASAEDIGQANEICGDIIRLVLQANIKINNAGVFSYEGVEWKRIPKKNQDEVAELLDKVCALPAFLQKEEFMPKLYPEDPEPPYDHKEFVLSPARSAGNGALKAVAIYCTKIVLESGLEEIVKFGAVDVLSCRILFNHLVCPDPNNRVKDWRTNITGLSSFYDMEYARQAGYKVLKGWQAVRAALGLFVDNKTIIIGHNLRADLDALRLIHGRGIDVVMALEKEAGGPLSRKQTSFHSLIRDIAKVKHERLHDPMHGQEVVIGALAVRELALWVVKKPEDFKKYAKARALDYQRINMAL